MNARTRTLLVGAAPIVALTAILSLPQLVVPFAAEGPGPLFNVLRDVDGTNIINVEGEHVDTQESKGQLSMTTVSVHHNLTLPHAFAMWANSENDIVPIESVFPPGTSKDAVEEQNKMMFTESEANATSAALAELGLPTKTVVALVQKDSAADGELEVDDEIVKVGNDAVSRPEQVKAAVASKAPGEKIDLTLKRKGKELTKSVELGEDSENPGVSMLGIGMSAQPAGNTEVDYKLSGIGGPSAGLMLSLGVIDKLSPGDLTEGRRVAGTGTIDAAGRVGEIGGIKHKIRAARKEGAEMFFVPAGNCAEALAADAGPMRLIMVQELAGAVEALKDPAAAPSCS